MRERVVVRGTRRLTPRLAPWQRRLEVRAPLLDHVHIGASDLGRSVAFYAQALAPLGLEKLFRRPGTVAFGHDGKPRFCLREGGGREPVPVAFAASYRGTVDAVHAPALETGGRDGGPRLGPEYHCGYHGAFALDPDRHDVEAVCHTGGS